MNESERHSLMGICLHFPITSLFIYNNCLGEEVGCGRGKGRYGTNIALSLLGKRKKDPLAKFDFDVL